MRNWIKPALILIFLLSLVFLAPVDPIDPWNLLSLKKIARMIFALALIQILGAALAQYLGLRAGAVLTGFLGGLISSTATTASLAKRSTVSDSGEILIFLAATGAMLFEGLIFVVTGSSEAQLSHVAIFTGPLLATIGMILIEYKKHETRTGTEKLSTFSFWSLVKLSIFIIAILTMSKILQNFLGESGLLVLTGLVSLFEIHGSVIANIQLHESEIVSAQFLNALLAISICASYVSKLVLIGLLGSSALMKQAVRSTLILICALLAGFALGSGA